MYYAGPGRIRLLHVLNALWHAPTSIISINSTAHYSDTTPVEPIDWDDTGEAHSRQNVESTADKILRTTRTLRWWALAGGNYRRTVRAP